MKIAIDIPNSIYANLAKMKNGNAASKRILDCVKNGTVFPKGHGRLIDADKLKEKLIGTDRYFSIKFDIDEAPTVLAADTEVEK